ncbi:flavin reductase family protein [bacterium]|nr:flavin reductase family protein [bacterium]
MNYLRARINRCWISVCLLAVPFTATGELKEVPVRDALARRFPEEIVLVTFQQADQPGIVAVGNQMMVPGVIALKKGTPAHTAVSASGEFVASYPGEDLEAAVRDCFLGSGETGPDLAKLGLAVLPGEKVKVPLLKQCLVNYECRVKNQADAGDATVFIADVVATRHAGSEARRLYLAGGNGQEPVLKALAGARDLPVPDGFEKYPEQIVMIASCDQEGNPNVMPAGWTMRVSDDPPMVAVAIGKTRFTHGLIRATGQFAYGYPGADMEQEMYYCGTHTGKKVDKFAELNLATQPAKKIKPPLLSKWVAAFECQVVGELDYSSHTIFIGRIEAAHVSDQKVPRIYNLGAGPDGQRVFRGLE